MNIEDLTIGEAKILARELSGIIGVKAVDSHWQIGKNYFIRTVTHHHTGKLVGVTEHELVLENAAWIASDGRLTDVLKSGAFDEVEVFPSGQVIIGRGSLIDACVVSAIPVSQK